MTQKVLVFAGRKQSGKSSSANFVAGYILSQLGRMGHPYCPIKFSIDEDGQLLVNTSIINADGETEFANGILDLNNKDTNFVTWAMNIMWPSVKLYSFADTLKEIAIVLFGLNPEHVYGTNEDKRKLTHIKWKDMCAFLPPKQVSNIKRAGKYDANMNVREFLQYFGTNICRKLYNECWTQNCFQRIVDEGSDLAIITDARFENEIKGAKKLNAKIIKLDRKVEEDTHESEVDLDKLISSNYDLVIDNQYLTIEEKNQIILDALYEWGWLNAHVELEQ